MFFHKQNEKGFAAFFITVMVSSIILSISASIFILNYGEQAIIANVIKSKQAYYAAEAGIEDSVYRIKKSMNLPSSYTLPVGTASVDILIDAPNQNTKIITATGSKDTAFRKLETIMSIEAVNPEFFYGAQVGEGGIQMQDAAKIEGNVFSNGSAIGTSKQKITGSAIVARNGNKIENLDIGGDAKVHTCKDSVIAGKLTYVSGGSVINCTVGGATTTQPNEIEPKDLPISTTTIQKWKADALSGGTSTGYTLGGKQEKKEGPKKIEGNLTVQDSAKLWLTGTIWVTGNIIIQNGGQILLDPDTYGSQSGVIIADDPITVQDTAKAKGTGLAGSYLLLLSTLDSSLTGQTAILLQNSPEADIIYASKGFIQLQDSIKLREVSGWGLKLQSKALVIYEVGLEEATFSSGPGGSWEVASWKEIE